MGEPASIRYKNPGAMWGGPRATKWGATRKVGLNDGTGQNNNIAVFPTYVQGAAAQFDLWRTGYCNMTLAAALRKWSGGNSSQAYINHMERMTGVQPKDVITEALLAGDKGWKMMRAQAQWEAGKAYPMTDEEWKTAQRMCFDGYKPPQPSKKGTAVVVATTIGAGAVVTSQTYGYSPLWTAVGVLVFFAVLGSITAIVLWNRRQ